MELLSVFLVLNVLGIKSGEFNVEETEILNSVTAVPAFLLSYFSSHWSVSLPVPSILGIKSGEFNVQETEILNSVIAVPAFLLSCFSSRRSVLRSSWPLWPFTNYELRLRQPLHYGCI